MKIKVYREKQAEIPDDYNTFQEEKVGQPIINKINIKDNNYDMPPYSFAILRIPILKCN